jgi:hypothetical protein
MDNDKQMSFLFEEGGMADDGLDRDPVSGNAVPSGSMAEEVRDDIPAQLSEGEYVVPADVVRYYGVKFFEDLRDDAKEGLTGMEDEGRIGGEPIDMEGDDTDLTEDEIAELESIMGMAVGGFVTEQATQATDPFEAQNELYRSSAPVAIGNTMQPRGFADGGDVPAETQVMPDFSQFGAGFSFMGPQAGQSTPVIQPSQNITLYGPNGEVVNLILPVQQALYDDLVSQGYSTQPAAQVSTPTVQTESGKSGGDGGFNSTQGTQNTQGTSSGPDLGMIGKVDFSDPIGDAEDALSGKGKTGGLVGGILGAVLGAPVIGAGIGQAVGKSNSIAEAVANAEIASILGYDVTDINKSIDSTIANSNLATRTIVEPKVNALRSQTRDKFFELLSQPTDMQFSLSRNAFQTQAAYDNALDSLARSVERTSGYAPGSTVAMGQGLGPTGASQFAEDFSKAEQHAAENPFGMTTGQPLSSNDISSLMAPTTSTSSGGDSGVVAGGYQSEFGYHEGPTAPSGGEGGDGGDGASVICTALHNLGLLDDAIFELDNQYGAMLEYEQPEVLYGYREMATPLAQYIQKDTLGAKIARKLVAPVAQAWAKEMAHVMQPEVYKGNLLGKAIIKLGYPVCAYVGRNTKEPVYGH